MSEKITLQSMADALVSATGVTKKVADTFLKQFFEVVQEGLAADGVVRIKGFGAFKLVEVAERESVSVSTGERMVISGYKKVTFTPDAEFKALLAVDDEEPLREEGIVNSEESTEIIQNTEDMIKEEEIEKPNNEFAAIDMLISTPESIEEAKADLERARETATQMQAVAEEALAAAREAHREAIRLEVLVKRLESNAQIETAAPTKEKQTVSDADADAETVAAEPVTAEVPVPDTDAADEMDEEQEVVEDTSRKSKKAGWIVFLVILFLVILGGGAYWYFVLRQSNVEVVKPIETKPAVVQPVLPVDSSAVDTIVVDSVVADSLTSDSVVTESVAPAVEATQPVVVKEKAEEAVPPIPKNPNRPKTYKIKNGDTLMRLARRYYGNAAYADSIIQANDFKDPNNVHVGTVIVLP